MQLTLFDIPNKVINFAKTKQCKCQACIRNFIFLIETVKKKPCNCPACIRHRREQRYLRLNKLTEHPISYRPELAGRNYKVLPLAVISPAQRYMIVPNHFNPLNKQDYILTVGMFDIDSKFDLKKLIEKKAKALNLE